MRLRTSTSPGAAGTFKAAAIFSATSSSTVEDVAARGIIFLRPQLHAVADLHQPEIQAHAVGHDARRALHEMGRVELLADGS